MKNISLVLVTFLLVATSVNAQEISKNAIGLRLGDSDGFGAEINYQRALDEDNRLELGLSFRDTKRVNAYKITGIYQWVWNIDGGFNWYAGPGAGIGQIGFEDEFFDDRSNETFVFAAGDIGIEYNFDFPLLVSLDFRPEFGFGDYRDDVVFDIALGARYQF
tara:strand:- start:25586 stop:26071 length:486 start_codon:yes stop_codon:yes gene_type:complete